jgi:ATP synthase protein I
VSYAVRYLRGNLRRLLSVQVALILAAGAVFLLLSDVEAARAALFGGLITLLNTVLLSWQIERFGEAAAHRNKAGLAAFVGGLFQRMLLTLFLLAVGLGALKLQPLPLLIAFAFTQIGFIATARTSPQGPSR